MAIGTVFHQLVSDRHRLVEMSHFVEEQSVRRSLGPAKWGELCNAIEKECANANEVRQLFLIDRTPLSCSIKSTQTAKRLLLRYDEAGPSVECQFSGAPLQNITFRVDTTPAPSLMLMWNGRPDLPNDLALSLIQAISS